MAVEWPTREPWQKCSYEEKLIWAIRVMQSEVKKMPAASDKLKEACILGDFAIDDA